MNMLNEWELNLSKKEKISILEKRINDYNKKISAFEKKYDITSDDVVKIEPDDYPYSDDLTEWTDCLYSKESAKSLLSALRQNT